MRNSPMRIGPKMSQSPCPIRLACESKTHRDRMDGGLRMRLTNTANTSRPWRIHELTRNFRLEDVWALPTPGGPDDFSRLVQAIASGDPSHGSSRVARALWAIRWKVGELLGWDGADAGGSARRCTRAGLRRAPLHLAVPDRRRVRRGDRQPN